MDHITIISVNRGCKYERLYINLITKIYGQADEGTYIVKPTQNVILSRSARIQFLFTSCEL